MKKISLYILLIILFSCSDQPKYFINEITSPNDSLTYLKKDMSPLNGDVFDIIKKRKKRSYKLNFVSIDTVFIGNYKNGEKNGFFNTYWENKQLKEIKNYKNNKLEGEYKKYYEDGQILSIVNYNNGKANSQNCWNKNGKKEECIKIEVYAPADRVVLEENDDEIILRRLFLSNDLYCMSKNPDLTSSLSKYTSGLKYDCEEFISSCYNLTFESSTYSYTIKKGFIRKSTGILEGVDFRQQNATVYYNIDNRGGKNFIVGIIEFDNIKIRFKGKDI